MSSATQHLPASAKRKPGRPRTYVFDKPDDLLTENELRQKVAVLKRRDRQNRSYQKKKAVRIAAQEAQRTREMHQHHLEQVRQIQQYHQQQQLLHMQQNGIVPQAMNFMPHVQGVPPTQPVNITAHSQNGMENTSQITHIANGQAPKPPRPTWPQNFVSPYAEIPTQHVSQSPYSSADSLRYVPQQKSPTSVSATSAMSNELHSPDLMVPTAHDQHILTKPASSSQEILSADSNSLSTPMQDDTAMLFEELEAESASVSAELGQTEDDVVAEALNAIQTEGVSEDVAMMTVEPPQELPVGGILLPVMTNKFAALDFESQAAVLDLVIFPETFDEKAAIAVTERSNMDRILDQLRAVSFVEQVSHDRFQLHSVAKSFLTTSSAPILHSVLSVSMTADKTSLELRFMKYFTNLLAGLEEDAGIHILGPARAKAVEEFDKERENMRYTQYLSREDSKAALNSFLTAASSVLRFCVSAGERAWVYQDALDIDANSSDAFAVKPELTPSEPVSSFLNDSKLADFGDDPDPEPEVNEVCPKMKVRATLQLGLAEAFYDMQQLMRVRDPLNGVQQTIGATTQLSCIPEIREKTLSLLLCANLSMTEGKIEYAKRALILTLKTLNDGGLAKSTYGVGALLGLIGVYSANQEYDKARKIGDELLEVLSSLGFERMPLYADCVGCRAAVLLATEEYQEAEQGFTVALEVIKEWINKDWSQIPMQHCLDLDLWLMEGLKRTLMAQGKSRRAYETSEQIREALANRGIHNRENTPLFNWERWWLNARYLY